MFAIAATAIFWEYLDKLVISLRIHIQKYYYWSIYNISEATMRLIRHVLE